MSIIIRSFDQCDYSEMHTAMSSYTDTRGPESHDEIWFLEHPPVYTLGLSGKTEHVLNPGKIPVIQSDRGGQVTYHGPGQLICYLLIDLKRRQTGIKAFVHWLEESIIEMLAAFDISAERLAGAPGVYIHGKKIAALGVRVRRGCSYHGLALNVDMDTAPFRGINPCGYPDLEVTQLKDHGIKMNIHQTATQLQPHLLKNLGYDPYNVIMESGKNDMLSGHVANMMNR